MNEKIIDIARKMAKQDGYHDVCPKKPWKGFEVLEAIYTDDITRFTGYPQYLLVKSGKVQWAKGSHCEEITEYQYEN